MKIYIINLPDSTARKNHMLEQMRLHGLTDFEFIEAVEHANPIEGCMQSHKNVWMRIAEDNEPAIVLEDDVILHDSFHHHLHNRWSGSPISESCHVALIGYQIKGQPVYSNPFANWRTVPGFAEFNGAYGYIVNGKQGAEHLLRLSQDVAVHPDLMMQDAANEGRMSLYFMNFPLVKHGSFPSTLNHNSAPVSFVKGVGKATATNGKPKPKGKIRLFINWYNEKNKARLKELQYCISKNLNNEVFAEVIDITENFGAPHIKHSVVKFNGRPTFNDFFAEVNKLAQPNDISVIANLDIFFDKTILEAHRLEKRDCFALTRWDIHKDMEKAEFFNRADSQDVWIFKGKIKKIKGADFTMGEQGCDNKLAHLLHKAGYNVTNPSLTIKTYHLHNSPIRHANPKKALKPPYKLLIPCL